MKPLSRDDLFVVENGEKHLRASALRQHGKQYRIVLRGELRSRFESEFAGMSVESRAGRTTLRGSLDQSQLHGVLERIQDFNLQIIEVEEVSEGASAEQDEETNE